MVTIFYPHRILGCEPDLRSAMSYNIRSGTFCIMVMKSGQDKTCTDQEYTCKDELQPALPTFFDAQNAAPDVRQEIWSVFAS